MRQLPAEPGLDLGRVWFDRVGFALNVASIPAVPVSIGIAVLRHRLYDIDLIINRTLVYGPLTAALALMYFGSVTATQATFRALISQEEPPQITIVVSTLVIAALFNPFRRRIQSYVDRRFYRKRYDAVKTLASLSAKLRDETDLNNLNSALLSVVRDTMEPEHLSLWRRPEVVRRDE